MLYYNDDVVMCDVLCEPIWLEQREERPGGKCFVYPNGLNQQHQQSICTQTNHITSFIVRNSQPEENTLFT